jgi:hexokinase
MLLLLPGCAQIMKGHGSTLFGFIADAVKRAGPPPGASVGFTFSFPVNQTALNSGTLMQWTKG